MKKLIYNWKGIQNEYSFELSDINVTFASESEGNYIFAKLVGDMWEAVYIGEGILQERTQDKRHRTCAISKGATHIFWHSNSDEALRKAEEADLLAYNTEAYAPKGCNIKMGG